ncbi:MAG: hypothetical protein IJA27_03150 [Lachnospiraceae bacterium]|nr:hypothetical protein [Lachnospiraceae bacterium]
MTVYLVDFENVRSEGLKGVENLSEDDKVVIFYSVNADAITFDVHMLLSKSQAEIETFRILRGGRNSLDFQLSTYLGYLVMENRYRDIVIVSKDKGFLCAVSFWDANPELCNADIRMSKSIAADENDEEQANYYNNEYEGKLIEKVSVIPHKLVNRSESQKQSVKKQDSKKAEAQETLKKESKKQGEPESKKTKAPAVTIVSPKQRRKKQSDITLAVKKETQKPIEQKNEVAKNAEVKGNMAKPTVKEKLQKKIQIKAPIQNPTSKNKIFAAEVKLNITDDVKEIIGEKYDEKIVPMLVEVIGKSTGKQHFYRMLVSRFGQEQGHAIYMMIKGQYANLKRK